MKEIPNFNNGIIKQKEAKGHLLKIYDFVESTKCLEFYDYLVKKGTIQTLIEVKWVNYRYKTISISIRWGQAKKLLKAKNFMLYIMTPKGNFFISPEQFYEYSHVHYNGANVHEKRIYLAAMLVDGEFQMTYPYRCPFCDGFSVDYIDQGKQPLLID